MNATFGEYIRKLRTDNGLTLTELAALLKLDSANLSKIENGKREFDEKRLDKLASAFSLDIEKLKVEYFGDQFAKKMFEFKCSPETLIVAEEKVKYLKSINMVQTEIKF
ncbi:MAG: helix-turn-helix transcriptional regulator [Bacteroidales bacterium]|nr:helix-turn-helix transcriptional regulator [Bacteroidales bacterium]MDD4216114.1 helix-turn-helix transcriptional regulator [Bacteroidales bacterium]MDY0142812.1 helix-turn-helix transcriptional regulator [Bacteroidales bacterium]